MDLGIEKATSVNQGTCCYFGDVGLYWVLLVLEFRNLWAEYSFIPSVLDARLVCRIISGADLIQLEGATSCLFVCIRVTINEFANRLSPARSFVYEISYFVQPTSAIRFGWRWTRDRYQQWAVLHVGSPVYNTVMINNITNCATNIAYHIL